MCLLDLLTTTKDKGIIMINRPPKNFTYNKDTSNLFLFYQRINEALFDYAPDSYKAPILNTRLLCDEAYTTYLLLDSANSVDKYYNKYISTIISELIELLTKDQIAKKLLDGRYDTIVGNLEKSVRNQKKFKSTIRNLNNYLGERKYYDAVVETLSCKIKEEKNQQEIIRLAELWICEICNLGYSKQHVYNITNSFFSSREITSPSVIDDFFKQFNFKKIKWQLLTFADKKLVAYINGLQKTLKNNRVNVEEFGTDPLKNLIQQSEYRKMTWFFNDLRALQELQKVDCIKCTSEAMDPYIAMQQLQKYIKTLSIFVTNYDNEDKKLYPYNVCLNYMKQGIIVQSPIDRRMKTYSQSYLNNTLKIINSLRVSEKVLNKIIKVLEYHSDAISQKSANKYVISTLWTALETLLIDGSMTGSKGDVVKDALIEIIQRTYLIKRLKYLQDDFIRNIKAYNEDLIEKYHLEKIDIFIEVLFDDSKSTRVQEIQATLEKNPLLRTRVYMIVQNELGNAEKIQKFLDKHREKINYQIDRIYRNRNFLIHAAQEMNYQDSIVECLHYYVDFVINYIFAKAESGDVIMDVYDVIEEARDDNLAHSQLLQKEKKTKTNKSNCLKFLFGPSLNVLEYYTDHIV